MNGEKGSANMKWQKIDDLPDYIDFMWVMRRSEKEPDLCYFYKDHKGNATFQVAATAGDASGLYDEYYHDVYLWSELEPPEAL